MNNADNPPMPSLDGRILQVAAVVTQHASRISSLERRAAHHHGRPTRAMDPTSPPPAYRATGPDHAEPNRTTAPAGPQYTNPTTGEAAPQHPSTNLHLVDVLHMLVDLQERSDQKKRWTQRVAAEREVLVLKVAGWQGCLLAVAGVALGMFLLKRGLAKAD